MAAFGGYATAILKALGAPATPQNMLFLHAWAQAEGGGAKFNPFNTTQPAGDASNYNSVGVKNYTSPAEGVHETVATLLNGRYSPIVNLLRSGKATAQQLGSAVAQSPWGTGSGVLRVLGAGAVKVPSAGSSSGRTPGSEPGSGGSTPSPAANPVLQKLMGAILLSNQAPTKMSGAMAAGPQQSGLNPLTIAMVQQALAQGGAQKPLDSNWVGGAQPLGGGTKKSMVSGGAAGGFLPKGAVYKPGRADQGRDGQTRPGTPMIAPGDGIVVRVASDPHGFGPRYPIVHFTSGPYAGHTLYLGHTLATVRPGQKFTAGTVLSHTGTTPIGNAGVPGWFEVGFAPGGVPGKFGQDVPFT